MKAISLQVNDRLYDNIKQYADDRDIPVVVCIRMLLAQFFINMGTPTKVPLPEGVIDLGDAKGLVIDMEKLKDKNGESVIPPTHLNKLQMLEWIRNRQNQIHEQNGNAKL